ncbi:hypothetical protein B0H11DRAFT_1904119 [Mycena galericulata]|nr:hypothetical protein B0H11DRAFT_1904119 [Mycena galericulata]
MSKPNNRFLSFSSKTRTSEMVGCRLLALLKEMSDNNQYTICTAGDAENRMSMTNEGDPKIFGQDYTQRTCNGKGNLATLCSSAASPPPSAPPASTPRATSRGAREKHSSYPPFPLFPVCVCDDDTNSLATSTREITLSVDGGARQHTMKRTTRPASGRLAIKTLLKLSISSPGKKGCSKLATQVPASEFVLESFAADRRRDSIRPRRSPRAAHSGSLSSAAAPPSRATTRSHWGKAMISGARR